MRNLTHDESYCLQISNASYEINNSKILKSVSACFPKGQITALIGPNGSGKSTLLKLLSGSVRANSGELLLDGMPIQSYRPHQLARLLAYLPQNLPIAEQITVKELVCCGRYPYHGLFKRFNKQDKAVVDEALRMTQLEGLSDKFLSALSGGQRQRAWIALCLAQQSSILILDEPTTYLDIRHQFDILNLLKQLNIQNELSIIWVVHDLNQAIKYSDYAVLMNDGSVIKQGQADIIINPAVMSKLFGIKVSCLECEVQKERVYVW